MSGDDRARCPVHLILRDRQAALLLAGAIVATLHGCGQVPVAPRLDQIPVRKLDVDDSPAWSPDGHRVAYHRRFPSSDGPPGVYVVGFLGGPPAFIVAGDYLGPTDLTFSPDGRTLVASWQGQIVTIDIASGDVVRPFYTDNYAGQPSWSPDGSTIAYSRATLDAGEPADSAGLHTFNLSTGSDQPFHVNGQLVNGAHSSWSPDGRWIAVNGQYPAVSPTLDGILRVAADGSSVEQLAAKQGAGYLYVDWSQWYHNSLTAADGILFRGEAGGQRLSRSTLVDSQGRWVRPWPATLWHYDRVSRDGFYFVGLRPEPGDSLGVIFVWRADDLSGASLTQLTSWSPASVPPRGEASGSGRAWSRGKDLP